MQHAFPRKTPNTSFSALCLPPTHQAVSTQAQGPSGKPERNANFWRPWHGEVALCLMQLWVCQVRAVFRQLFLSRHAVTTWPCCQYKKLDIAAPLLKKLQSNNIDHENAQGPILLRRFGSLVAQISKQCLFQVKTYGHPCRYQGFTSICSD